jgi:hypothetical protein
MKFDFGKDCNLLIYQWHSINLVPAISWMTIVSDDNIDQATGCCIYGGEVIGHSVELVLLGTIFNFMYPSNKHLKFYSSKVYGPLYSRKRKQWYREKE